MGEPNNLSIVQDDGPSPGPADFALAGLLSTYCDGCHLN